LQPWPYSKYLHRINQGIRDGRGFEIADFCVLESISRCIRGGQRTQNIWKIRGGWVNKIKQNGISQKKTALSLKPTQNTPRGLEQNPVKNDIQKTYNSASSARRPEKRPESAQPSQIPSDLQRLIDAWPSLSEQVKQSILNLLQKETSND
jgi:hypothetical protein